MSWRVFSQVLKFVSQLRSDYVSAVAQVLKSFDENHSSSFDWLDKEVHPKGFSVIKQKKREGEYGRRKVDDQLKKSDDVAYYKPTFFPERSLLLF